MARQFQIPDVDPPGYIRLGEDIPFSGINLKVDDTGIMDGQTPYGAKNYNLDDGGKPTKRKGLTYVYTTSLGSGEVHGIYKEEFNGRKVFAWNTSLYTQVGTSQPVQIMTGLANQQGYFYVFNDVLYYKNGVDFIQISSSFVTATAASNSYIPTLTGETPPGGGGTVRESRNMIQPGFKISYSGTSGTTAYTLPFQSLDATAITAVVNGSNMVETTNFTVNRTTGIVTFNVAPGVGTNNVVITAYKTFTGFNAGIGVYECLYVDLFGGGTNDSRVFMCGSQTYKNVYFYTGLTGNTSTDATYFPENSWNRIGSDAKLISGWSKIYSKLLALKEESLYTITYSNVSGTVTFPVSILNAQIGCDMPGSIQIIQDSPVFFNTVSGGHRIIPTFVEAEKNVVALSALINGRGSIAPGLLDNTVSDLQKCSSFDDGQKYGICVGTDCYVWDYELSPFGQTGQSGLIWYYYDNINAVDWAFIGRTLYYADRSIGQIVKLQDNKNDFGSAINGVWKSKLFDFGHSEILKDVTQIWLTSRALGGATLNIVYYDENSTVVDTAEITAGETNSFNLSMFSLDRFTVYVTRYASVIRRRPKLKKIKYFQIEVTNNVVNEDLSIIKLVIEYMLKAKVK